MDLRHIITLLSKRTSREMNIIAEYILRFTKAKEMKSTIYYHHPCYLKYTSMFYIQIYVAVIRYTSENSLDTHFYVYLMHNVLNVWQRSENIHMA